MAYLTERELLDRFEYYTIQLEERLHKEKEIDDVINEIPFCISLNDPQTFELLHVNKVHEELSGFAKQEVRENWDEYIKIVHPKSVESILSFLPEFYQTEDPIQTISFVQHVKAYQQKGFVPCMTFSKSSSLPNDLKLWLTITPDQLSKETKKIERIIKMDEFKLKHFKQFQALTGREIEVLGLLANGYNNPEIADKLFLSRSTVETHRKNIKRKLELKSLRDLMRYAFAFNLVEV